MKLPISVLANAALSLLGKTGKGKATKTSVGIGVGAGVAFGLGSLPADIALISQSVQDVLVQIAVVAGAISTLLFQFGIGRKAGVKLAEDTKGE